MKNQKDLAILIADSFEVGDDCRSKLRMTWRSIDEFNDQVEKFNSAQGEQVK